MIRQFGNMRELNKKIGDTLSEAVHSVELECGEISEEELEVIRQEAYGEISEEEFIKKALILAKAL